MEKKTIYFVTSMILFLLWFITIKVLALNHPNTIVPLWGIIVSSGIILNFIVSVILLCVWSIKNL